MNNRSKIMLKTINHDHFEQMISKHKENGGEAMDKSLSKLFAVMNDESNLDEVKIKVAALNTLYSTAIQNIKPVAKKIADVWLQNSIYDTEKKYADFIDDIARVEWINNDNAERYTRHNLSFASKYVHFLSKFQTPIYDSYIWIIMIGYLRQKDNSMRYSFSSPENYAEFYKIFNTFKESYQLQSKTNYEIDKFLWQYGKMLIDEIIDSNNDDKISLEKAKSVLKKQL